MNYKIVHSKLGTLGEEYDSDESDEDYKSKSKPSFLKKQASNDKDLPSKSRPKSPSESLENKLHVVFCCCPQLLLPLFNIVEVGTLWPVS